MGVLTFDVGLAAKLKKAMNRAGWNEEDINTLAESRKLKDIRNVLRGHATITHTQRVIDCDAGPYIPEAMWRVEEHKPGGQFTFDPSQIELYLDNGQKYARSINGNVLRQRLVDKLCLNANVLDFLIANPDLIPEEWKTNEGRTRYICFWGTIYSNRSGELYVRYLCWRGGWSWGIDSIDTRFRCSSPAAVRAS